MREKEEFIRDFNEAFATNEVDFILNSMTEDIEWHLVGDQIINGKQAVEEIMEQMKGIETLESNLFQIISHGNLAAANGRMKIKDPSGAVKTFGFSDFYELEGLKSPKIKKMTSYVVKVKEEKNK
ncbi:hypothetical protein GCM10007103_05700 [Salinimicrobium marinum]|uniref:SnoaL-like domain-containing protein n=1 Tax=Salinimicrobium marinum TaxID=680283 RepID=A0A918S6M1_9FLAO|nr:nuclear transport factor 2 family protein [Salinimicrobium marinum]GHA27168.1 hypothetical protein GCM10007103_05700 [Salinimicrobium marinum]